MNDIKDLTGLEKPLTKLIETISEGVGVVGNDIFKFDARKIKRIGDAEAETEKKKIIKQAEAQEEAIAILDRAGKRFALEQYNKQINLENIIVSAKEKLTGENVSDDPVDKDWIARFMNIAQEVSREDMQDILSQILAEEIKKPNTFSLHTLNFVRNLSSSDLQLFSKFTGLLGSGMYIFMTKNNANMGFFDITYADIMDMSELGFIQPSLVTVLKLSQLDNNNPIMLIIANNVFQLKIKEKKEITLPILQLSVVGRELAPLISINQSKNRAEKYIDDLKEFWTTKGIDIKKVS